MSALTRKQKTHLAILAKEAYDKAFDAALERGVAMSRDAEEWRHGEVAKACGKAGLRCCGQDDYKLVEGHFLNLLGRPGAALNAFVRAQSEPKRQAEAVLLQKLAKWGFARAYVEKICRDRFKCSVSEASAKQIWFLCYDVDRNGRARAGKAVAA